ncbi:hypothetical protein Pcinc_009070 [Petrolisthes cinctipes]|uniref:Uncharacterized protein n=1 Tax=Petrolisthes cinctipes TaxID=88211 RepID=A0AAE1G7N2_PETCI|nr:hypothetical protein Pcinc_009070 [Petrolisthes cinctipes]
MACRPLNSISNNNKRLSRSPSFSTGAQGQSTSCVGRCGVDDGVSTCQCNSLCTDYGDCCSDFVTECMSCQDRCGEAYLYSKPCQCNNECGSHGNCCTDYDELCGGTAGGVTDQELWDLIEQMFAADMNSVGDQLVIDLQGQGTSGDLAPGPLFVSVPPEALSGPTLSTFVQLQDNYIPSVTESEVEDATEVTEQQAFLDAVMATEVMQLAEAFLQSKNLVTSLRDKLDEIWFTMYTRSGSIVGSSGFEHVFMGELKNGAVSGFHNWVSFQKEEAEGDLNYEGYEKIVDLGTMGSIIMHHFKWLTEPKNIGSMYIGTSPELEMAANTVCFLARPDSLCPAQMNGYKFQIQTWTQNYNGKVLVGSAYPDI